MSEESGGRFLLRIEDIDPERCRPEYEAAICEDLAWAWPEVGAASEAAVGAHAGICGCPGAAERDG